MFQSSLVKTAAHFALVLFLLSAFSHSASALAQTGNNSQEDEQKVTELIKQQKYTEALPLLEKLVIAQPDNALIRFYLGFALLAQANNTKDAATRKDLRIRARNAFIKSKEMGVREPVVDALIQSLPPDGSDGKAFSQNAEAN
jgi:hypothetical protein